MPAIIIVSACLAGVNCRYNGTNGKIDAVWKMVLSGKALPICPEILGGLEIPRLPCEIITKNAEQLVINQQGKDMTRFFHLGAEKTLDITKIVGATTAILKSRSPSCGFGKIYDGAFSWELVDGNGLTAALLIKNGIRVLTEENFITYYEE